MIINEAEARAFCEDRLNADAYHRLEDFVALLVAENARQNLVANASLDDVWRRHIADSVQLIDHVPRGTGTWLDLGSGGGFPGLIIGMALPERSITLVESRRLRADWLQAVARELGLMNVAVLASRLETVPHRSVDVISARAFAPLPKLLRVSARFSTPMTDWVLPKGRTAGQELQEQTPAVRRMFHVEQSLTDPDAGILIGRGVPELQ